jgi:hypothetical protein
VAANLAAGKSGNKKNSKHHGRRNLSAAAIAALGEPSYVRTVRHSVTPETWQRIVHRARQQGVSVEGFLSGLPHPLQERSRQNINRQARTTVNAAYAPALSELRGQDKRTRALDEKRKADNAHYLDWLSTQSTKIVGDAKAADALLADKERGLVTATADGYKQLHEQAVAQAGDQTGTVSDFSHAAALDFSGQGERGVATIAAGAQQGLEAAQQHELHAATLQANNFAISASNDAKRAADTWKTLSETNDKRTSLKLKRAADTASEVSRLLDQEITKANANRDAAAVQAKLKISADTLASKNAQFAATFGLAKQRLSLDQQKFLHLVHVDNVKLSQNWKKLSQGDRRLTLGWFKARHGRGSGGGGSKTQKLGQLNQYSFDTGYANLSLSTFGKHNHTITSGYVQHHHNAFINQLVHSGLNRETATRVVNAYITFGGSDPGKFTDWGHGGQPHG